MSIAQGNLMGDDAGSLRMLLPAALETRTQAIGHQILARARHHRPQWWPWIDRDDLLMQQLMADPRLRLQLLRFVDVLPVLHEDVEVVRHLEEYLDRRLLDRLLGGRVLQLPRLADWGLRHAREGLPAQMAAGLIRAAVSRLARRFIAGRDPDRVLRNLERLHRRGMSFTLDVLGEATVSEAEAEAYQQSYLRLIRDLGPRVAQWGAHGAGMVTQPRLNLSIKISSLFSQLDAVDMRGSVAAVIDRLRPIMEAAREHHAFLTLDMEQYDTKAITLAVFKEVLLEPAFRDWPDMGIAIQAYLRDTPDDLAELIAWAEARGTPVRVRLVRGAYWDYEMTIAAQQGWPVPVWQRKYETDACYERCARMLFEAWPAVVPAIATHNVRSHGLAMALAESRQMRPGQWELQMLYGMADQVKAALVDLGAPLRVYVPFGDLIPGMAYLVRRLLENTASQSFLRMGMLDEEVPESQLLAPPTPMRERWDAAEAVIVDDGATAEGVLTGDVAVARGQRAAPLLRERRAGGPGVSPGVSPALREPVAPTALPPYRPEPVHRFADPTEHQAMAEGIAHVRSQLGRSYTPIIGGEAVETGVWEDSTNPARPAEVVGRVAQARVEDVSAAVAAARGASASWGDYAPAARAAILLKAASLMRSSREELAAWQVFEAGKPWREADGDVAEAIDFLEYYAREGLRYASGLWLSAPGETNRLLYEPRGVGVVIAPWNFPLAIFTGMVSAALAAGNTVVAKPAPQTPVVAAGLASILAEAGLPPGVLNFLPGPDSVGAALVEHPDVHFVAFTGSEAVGRQICVEAAKVREGQQHLKHVIAEMGGKNAIIVDADADLDDAVQGIVRSAFGFGGQKCSAASRVIALGSIYDGLVHRLEQAVASIQMGMPEDAGTFLGPLIDAEARRRVEQAIDLGRGSGRLILRRPVPERLAQTGGHFVGPALFADVQPESALAQNEIFGPVLAVMRARDFHHALALAQNTRYALTAGLYSRSPRHIEEAARTLRVGNLYINRKITGAIVGRQPFGGGKLSGTGSKAGGPDYLGHFLQARTVTENTLRRGFAPAEGDVSGRAV